MEVDDVRRFHLHAIGEFLGVQARGEVLALRIPIRKKGSSLFSVESKEGLQFDPASPEG